MNCDTMMSCAVYSAGAMADPLLRNLSDEDLSALDARSPKDLRGHASRAPLVGQQDQAGHSGKATHASSSVWAGV